MSDALFSEADAYTGDPLHPDMDNPTPPGVVATLSSAQRTERVTALTAQARQIVTDAINLYGRGRELTATCVLFSGGNDSITLAHLFRHDATHAIHANTTIGIEQTRQFVRDTCAAWDLPLVEKHPPEDYETLVLDQGFPGPGMHWKMYQRLKERCLDAARHDIGVADSRTRFALYLAGRRREESERRKDIPLHEPDGSVVWASPLAMWTKLDIATYRTMHGDVPHNEVTDLLHMSGECLCGAFAHEGELDEIGDWFPEVRAHIETLQTKVAARGFPEPVCRWGWGWDGSEVPSKVGRLCSSCRPPMSAPLFDMDGAA